MIEKWIVKLLPLIVKTLTPSLKGTIREFLTTLENQAKQTKNPWDDFAVELLKSLLKVD